MSDLQTPYHYARDHYGDGHWCVRGPGDFYLSVPEKNLAWCVAAMLNGHGEKASKEARGLMTMLERDGMPKYLQEPAFLSERREQAGRTSAGADTSNLSMKDRLRQRLERGWSSATETMEDVILEVLATPTPDMIAEGYGAAYAADTGVDEVAEVVVEHAYAAMIRAAKEGK